MEKPCIYVTKKLPGEAMGLLEQECHVKCWEGEGPVPGEVLKREISSVQGVLTMLSDKVDGPLMDLAPTLKVISNMAVGFDNIDIEAATSRAIMVANTPGVLTEATADLAWSLLMAAARRIVEGDNLVRNGGWKTWSPMFMCGQDVYGTTLGIIGMGRIGLAVARRARGFGMRVLYYKRNRDLEQERESGLEYADLKKLLAQSDYVSIHCPLTSETRNLLGKKEFDIMKPTAVLVNTSRGPVIDEQALYQALKDKKIWAAGLDVFYKEPVPQDHPLLSLDNVVLAPHVGSATFSTRTKMAAVAAQNLVEGLSGRVPKFLVNPGYQ